MAKYALSTSDNLTKRVYEEKLFRDTLKESYFARFMQESSDSPIHVQTDLEKGSGDRIIFGLRMRLEGEGVTEGTILEGNEEALNTYSQALVLSQYRHAVRDDGEMTRQRAMFNVTEEQENAIKDWGAEKIDQLVFDAITGGTPTQVVFNNSSGNPAYTTTAANAITGLHATNSKIDLDLISFVKGLAKTGHGRSFIPLRPIKIGGKKYYILLASPDVLYDLKTNTNWQQAQRDAQSRGDENPLFSGAAGIWDGVIVHEHENVPNFTNGGGGSVAYSKCVLLGAQAILWGWGARPELVIRDFDYGDQVGMAYKFIAKTERAKFNSKDYGSIAVYLARTQVSDAASA